MRRAKVNGWRSNWQGQGRQRVAGRCRRTAGFFFARLRQDFFCPPSAGLVCALRRARFDSRDALGSRVLDQDVSKSGLGFPFRGWSGESRSRNGMRLSPLHANASTGNAVYWATIQPPAS